MVDISEAYSAIQNTPKTNAKQRLSFVYKLFFTKAGDAKPVNVINYVPGFVVEPETITVVRNMRIKLRKNYIVEQDFVIIPSGAGDIYIPLDEVSSFNTKLAGLVNFIGQHNENQANR